MIRIFHFLVNIPNPFHVPPLYWLQPSPYPPNIEVCSLPPCSSHLLETLGCGGRGGWESPCFSRYLPQKLKVWYLRKDHYIFWSFQTLVGQSCLNYSPPKSSRNHWLSRLSMICSVFRLLQGGLQVFSYLMKLISLFSQSRYEKDNSRENTIVNFQFSQEKDTNE